MNRRYRTVWSNISNTFVAVTGADAPAAGQGAARAADPQRALVRSMPGLMRLEPRLVFDGAAVETFASEAVVDDAAGVNADADIALPLGGASLNEGAVTQAELDKLADVNRDGMLQLVDAEGEASEVLIIDSRLPGLADLLGDIRAGVDVWLLDATSSALDQISSILARYQNLDALHLVSHGSEGAVYLGADTLSSATLANQADTLAAWGAALSASGDILLYGCDIAAGEAGMAFVEGFAAATGADVAASDDATGASWLGGDWELEARQGAVETTETVAPQFAAYDGLLDVITGTNGNDTLTGTIGDDTIYGQGGNDTISALDGADIVYGDDGNDTVYGGGDNDTLYGGAGNDFLYGATGDDYLYGEDGNDGLSGGDGNDTIFGAAGNDTLMGATGDDYLSGGDGNDWLWGQKGNDILWGEEGNDTLSGDADNDTLYGGDGHDTLSGGSDADFLYGGDGNDVLSGMQGIDHLYGDAGDDTLYGGADADFLYGGTGNDVFRGSATELNGDTLGDLEAGDVLQLSGVTGLSTANVRFNGSGLLEIDTNGTDFSTVEVTLALGNGAGSTLQVDTVSDSGGSTLITFKAANTAPVITSDGGGATAAVSAAENQTAVTTVIATDVDGDTPTFAITGGADQALFSIDSTTGVLRFLSAPDFEAPADSNADNAYVVEVTASDGQGGTTVQTITVNVTDVAESTLAPIVEPVPVPTWPTETTASGTVVEPLASEPPTAPQGLGASAVISTPDNLGLGGQTAGGTTSGSPLAAILGLSGTSEAGGGTSTSTGNPASGSHLGLSSFYGLNTLLAPAGFGGALGSGGDLRDRLGGGFGGGLGGTLGGGLGGAPGASGALGGTGETGEFGAPRGAGDGSGDGGGNRPAAQPSGQPGSEGGERPEGKSLPAQDRQSGDSARLDASDAPLLAGALRDQPARGDGPAGKPALSEQLRLNGSAGRQAERDALLAHARAAAAVKAPNS